MKILVFFFLVMESRWNAIDRGKPKYSGKNLSHCHFVHHKSHMDWPPGSKPGLRGERPATDRLSHYLSSDGNVESRKLVSNVTTALIVFVDLCELPVPCTHMRTKIKSCWYVKPNAMVGRTEYLWITARIACFKSSVWQNCGCWGIDTFN